MPKILIGLLNGLVVTILVIYALHLITLIILFFVHRKDSTPALPIINNASIPHVVVQIPIRNERYVVNRILQAVINLDWPIHKLHIQVLDDSEDDTYQLAESAVSDMQERGYLITLIHRKNNMGYKAGALAVGMAYTDCEYIAIFDADFYPDSQFLKQTVPYLLSNPELAMVQTRWTYENEGHSFVTKCQALALDGHFVVDHIARNRSKLLMNFNGTAGIWRRSAITKAKGWQDDTLAEDLDLSYRVQLAGYRCLYLPNIVSPSLLPLDANSFLHQQRRWAKGAAQALRKLAKPILTSTRLNIKQKIMALLHLSGYSTQLLFILLIILCLPMTLMVPTPPQYMQILGPISIFPIIYYASSQITLYPDGVKRMLYYPFLALLALACSYEITLAMLDGFLNWGGIFIRTPKFFFTADKSYNPVYSQREETRVKLPIFMLIYIILTMLIALYSGVVHYLFPGIIFISAQLFFHLTAITSRIKKREK